MHGLDNRIIAQHATLECLTVLRDRFAFLTVTVLDAAQDDKRES